LKGEGRRVKGEGRREKVEGSGQVPGSKFQIIIG